MPIYSPYHVSTETAYGFNLGLKRDDHSYVALATLNFFEFIPEDEIYNDKPKTVLVHQVPGDNYTRYDQNKLLFKLLNYNLMVVK